MFDKLVTDEVLAQAINALCEAAAAGDLTAIKYLLDRVLGAATVADLDTDQNHDLLGALIDTARARAKEPADAT